MNERRPTGQEGLLRALLAVLAGFLGVRRRSEYEKDAARLKPLHVIVAGILAAAIFVVVLVMIARSAAG